MLGSGFCHMVYCGRSKLVTSTFGVFWRLESTVNSFSTATVNFDRLFNNGDKGFTREEWNLRLLFFLCYFPALAHRIILYTEQNVPSENKGLSSLMGFLGCLRRFEFMGDYFSV